LKHKKVAPSYGLGTEKRTQSSAANISPSPNAYNVSTNFVQKAAARWGFGSEKRGQTANPSFAPGPGNYKIDSMAFGTKYKFHMG